MNIKKSLAGLAAGFALIGTLAAPAAMASTTGTSATVWIGDGGTFSMVACGAVTLVTSAPPTAQTPGLASGSLHICYTDTKSYRDAFTVRLSTGDFTSGTTDTDITANNLTVAAAYSVIQDHWTHETNPAVNPPYGDIGFYVNEAHVSQNVPNFTPQGWNSNQSLDQARLVNYGWAGRGTTHSDGQLDLALNIPSGTQEGTYTSQLTLTITMETP